MRCAIRRRRDVLALQRRLTIFLPPKKSGGEALWRGPPLASRCVPTYQLTLISGPAIAAAFFRATSDHHHQARMALFIPGVRRLVLRGPYKLSICSQCLRQAPRRPKPQILDAVGWRGYANASPTAPALGSGVAKQETVARAFPRTTSRGVAYWLLGSAASVFGIVVFGGLTRLTESG